MNGATSTTQELFNCAACGQTVTGRLALSVEMSDVLEVGNDRSVNAQVKIVGMAVSHDCTPQAKRSTEARSANATRGGER